MSGKNKSIIAQELEEIFEGKEPEYTNNYISIREIYKSEYGWPELDPIRYEICLCIICGYFQASITLTNHLIERSLKYALIYKFYFKKQSKRNKPEIVPSLVDDLQPGIKKFDSKNMYDNIEKAFEIGLINDEQKNRLHQIRKKFRNPFSHADQGKIYGESTIPVQGIEFKNDDLSVDEKMEEKIKNLPLIQGLTQIEYAKEFAIPYFKEIDSLIRSIFKKVLEK